SRIAPLARGPSSPGNVTSSPPVTVTAEPSASARESSAAARPPAAVAPRTEKRRGVSAKFMYTGATDGLFVRNAGIPVYGVSAIAENPGDQRAHGQDERIRVESYYDALEYWYRLVTLLAQD